MAQCDALTRTGHLCRGYGVYDPADPSKGVLCHVHSTFYDDPTTLYDIIERTSTLGQTQAQRSWAATALKSRAAQNVFYRIGMTALAEANILAALESDSSFEQGRADYMYETFLRGGIFGPKDLRQVWRRAVLRQLRVLQFCAQETRIPPYYPTLLKDLLIPFFEGADAEYTITYLLTAMAMRPFRGDRVSFDTSGIMWHEVLNAACRCVDMREFISVDLDDYLDIFVRLQAKLHSDSPLVYPPIKENVRELLKEHIDAAKRRIAAALDPLKEELMAVCWSPARVAAALEAGRELEDL